MGSTFNQHTFNATSIELSNKAGVQPCAGSSSRYSLSDNEERDYHEAAQQASFSKQHSHQQLITTAQSSCPKPTLSLKTILEPASHPPSQTPTSPTLYTKNDTTENQSQPTTSQRPKAADSPASIILTGPSPPSSSRPSSDSDSDSGDSNHSEEGDMVESASAKQHSWEQQNWFYNDSGIKIRAKDILQWIENLLKASRPASPTTSYDQVPKIQAALHNQKNESDIPTNFTDAIIKIERMIRKKDISDNAPYHPRNYEACSWKASFLGSKTRADLKPKTNHVPVMEAPPDSVAKHTGGGPPKIEGCVPDILVGFDKDLLPPEIGNLFAKHGAEVSEGILHGFFTCQFKTNNVAILDAFLQDQRDLAALGWSKNKWDVQVETGSSLAKVSKYEARLGPGAGKSFVDADTIIFSAAVQEISAFMHVGFREVWENGAIYWHTLPIHHYTMMNGFEASVAEFQRHVSNVLDWGVGERAEKLFGDAATLANRASKRNDIIIRAEDFFGNKRAKLMQ